MHAAHGDVEHPGDDPDRLALLATSEDDRALVVVDHSRPPADLAPLACGFEPVLRLAADVSATVFDDE